MVRIVTAPARPGSRWGAATLTDGANLNMFGCLGYGATAQGMKMTKT